MNRASCERRKASSRFPFLRRLKCELLEDRRMLSVLFVDDDAAGGGDGLAWASAYGDLQSALEHAAVVNSDGVSGNDVDQIWIAEGTYLPSAEMEPGDVRSASFSLLDGVSLYGGFQGNETTLENRVSWYADRTLLSGDIGVAEETSDNAYTVVYCGEAVNVVLDNVEIVRGNADGSSFAPHQEGGGVYNVGSLTLNHCDVQDNYAESGGGIFNSGTLTVTKSSLLYNRAYSNGGGIYNASGSLAVTNVTVWGNSANDGGGVFGAEGTLTLTNSAFVGNSAETGGGISLHNGVLTITNCTLAGNVAETAGGGIYLFSETNFSTAVLNNTLIAQNSAADGPDVKGNLDTDLSGSHSLIGDGSGIDPDTCFYLVYVNDCIIGDPGWPIDPFYAANPSDGGDGWGDNPETLDVDESANDFFGDLNPEDFSEAVDAGDRSLLPADQFDLDQDGDLTEPVPIDLNGNDRVQRGRILDWGDTIPIVDIGAYETIYATIGIHLPGDCNGDGMVGSADLDIIRSNWGQMVEIGAYWMGDETQDGYVDSMDLDVVRANWGRSEYPYKAASASSSESASHSDNVNSRKAATDAVFGDIHAQAQAQWQVTINALKDDADEPYGPKRRNAIDLAWLERR